MSRWLHPMAVVCLALVACQADRSDDSPFDVTLPAPVPFVTTESEAIGYPTDLAVTESGVVWIVDSPNRRIVAVSPDGRVLQSVGREGSGPGELQSPAALVASDTLVRVVDARLMRVQDYGSEGGHRQDHTVGASMLGLADVSLNGRVVSPTFGMDSSLATVRSLDDPDHTLRLGPPVAPAPPGFDMSRMRSDVAEGRVPVEFRNDVTPVIAADGGVWLLLQTEAEIRRYSATGELQWSTPLDVPEVEAARQAFFRTNEEQTDRSAIARLTTFRAATESAGALWILMGGSGDVAALYVTGPEEGNVRGRYTVPVSSQPTDLAIDEERKRLYLSFGDMAAVGWVDLSDAGPSRR
jgi:hypothetical protein